MRYVVMDMTWSANRWICWRSVGEISVPILITAAALSTSSRSSGKMVEKSVVAALVRKPIALTTFA